MIDDLGPLNCPRDLAPIKVDGDTFAGSTASRQSSAACWRTRWRKPTSGTRLARFVTCATVF